MKNAAIINVSAGTIQNIGNVPDADLMPAVGYSQTDIVLLTDGVNGVRVGVSDAASSGRSFPSVAEMRAASFTDGEMVNLTGYYAENDGGGGRFKYLEAGSDSANGGTIFTPDAGAGRLYRQYSGRVNIRWCGAKGNGIDGDAPSILAAMGIANHVLIPAGVFPINVGLTITVATTLEFERGGILRLDADSVTVNGAIVAGAWPIFSFAPGAVGNVQFSAEPRIERLPVEWFGADPTYVLDSTVAFQKWGDAPTASFAPPMTIGIGAFDVRGKITIKSRCKVYGAGLQTVIAYNPQAIDEILFEFAAGSDGIEFHHLDIHNNNNLEKTGAVGMYAAPGDANEALLDEVYFRDFNKYAVHFRQCIYPKFYRCRFGNTNRSVGNFGDGLQIGIAVLLETWSYHVQFLQCRFFHNDCCVIAYAGTTIIFRDNTIEQNGNGVGSVVKEQVLFQNIRGVTFDSNYLESNRSGTDAVIRCTACRGVTITGNEFAGMTGATVYHTDLLYFDGANRGVTIAGNEFQDVVNKFIKVESASAGVRVANNYFEDGGAELTTLSSLGAVIDLAYIDLDFTSLKGLGVDGLTSLRGETTVQKLSDETIPHFVLERGPGGHKWGIHLNTNYFNIRDITAGVERFHLDGAGKLYGPAVISATTGFRINDGAANGNYARGDGTNFVSSPITAADVQTLVPVWSQTHTFTSGNFINRLSAADGTGPVFASQKRGQTGDINGAVLAGSALGQFDFYGWNGSAYVRGGKFFGLSVEDFTGAAYGGIFAIATTTPGTTVDAERIRIGLGVSVGQAVEPGVGVLNVLTGFRINNGATSGTYLRGNGTDYISGTVGTSDVVGLAGYTATWTSPHIFTARSTFRLLSADGVGPVLAFEKRGRTGDINGAVLDGSAIGQMDFDGWNGSAYVRGAKISGVSTEDFTGSAYGGAIIFTTTTIGTTTDVERMRIGAGVSVGQAVDPGYGLLNVQGGFRINNTAEVGMVLVGDGTRFYPAAIGDLQGDIVFGTPSTLVGLTTSPGFAPTAIRTDAQLGLSQSIVPTWTGPHTHRLMSADLLPPTLTFQKAGASAGGSPEITPTVNYQATFDNEYTTNQATFDSMSISGWGPNYYTFQYVLMGTLSMFEATLDTKYLLYALVWAEAMVTAATITDSNGKKNWGGIWASPYSATNIAYQLEDIQGATEMARVARIIITDAGLNATYGTRAQAVYAFVRDHIFNKNILTRSWLSEIQGFLTQTTNAMNDKPLLVMNVLLDLKRISAASGGADNTTYGWPAMLDNLADLVLDHGSGPNRWTSLGGGIIWDENKGFESPYLAVSVDTMHANRMPACIIELMRDGIVFDEATYVVGLANLLTNVIWTGSLTDIRFNNFINGVNTTYRNRGPFMNGFIYSGWAMLAEFDLDTFVLMDAVLKQIVDGNPTYLSYNDTIYGRIALSGHLAKAATTYTPGTSAGDSAAAILNNSGLGYIDFEGWTGSAYATGAYIAAYSSQDFTGVNNGSRLEIFTTPLSSSTPASSMTILSTGFKLINAAAAGSLVKGDGTVYKSFALGTALQVLRVNAGATDLEWAAASGGSTSPGGADTNVQFNNGGAFYGTSTFIWDNTIAGLAIGKTSFSGTDAQRLLVYDDTARTANHAVLQVWAGATSSTNSITKWGLHVSSVGSWTGTTAFVFGLTSVADGGSHRNIAGRYRVQGSAAIGISIEAEMVATGSINYGVYSAATGAGGTNYGAYLAAVNGTTANYSLYCTTGDIRLGDTGYKIGFIGATPVVRQPVTGSRAGNAALASALTALANLGLITDSSS